jgi:hypothetical protein
MAIRSKTKKGSKKKVPKKRVQRNYVTVANRSYGRSLKGIRIYFEGRKPSALGEDGRIKLGKHILEALTKQFSKFRWIITPSEDSIRTERNIVRVRTSQPMLRRMSQEEWNRGRDTKNDIVRHFFSIAFPEYFTHAASSTYVPGTLSTMLNKEMIPRLSGEDKEALTAFIPEFAAAESIGTVNRLRASATIRTLTELAEHIEREIDNEHVESWWQKYIQGNILLIQQGYIKALGKLNIAVGTIKLPDFSLVTHDNYLDILEIKKPNTSLLKLDKDRNNYYWDTEIAKAISQVENYIENVSNHRNDIRAFLKDTYNLEVRAIRPRGIILAGDARKIKDAKMSADFRLLREGIKNVTVLTYDELVTRLRNYITVLEEFSNAGEQTKSKAKGS